MKKILIYLFLLIIVFGIGIILIINQTNIKEDKVLKPKQESSKVDKLENDEKAKEQDDPQEEVEEKETKQRQFSEVVVEAVQGTIDYFSNKETRVVAVGDSLTQGVGDSKGEGGYIGILDRTVNANKQLVTFDNYGVRGHKTNQLLKRLDDEEVSVAIEDADIVLMTIGANDIMKVVRENITNLTFKDFVQERVDYEQRLRSIFDKIREINPDTEIYLLGFYNPFDQYFEGIKELNTIVEEWNRTGTEVAADYDAITFIPVDDLFEETDINLFAEDNFHPNDLGYQRMAKRVLEYLTNNEG